MGPLDDLAQQFADFGAEATNPIALQVVGSTFLALSHEASAYQHYANAWHSLWRHSPSVVNKGMIEATDEIGEALSRWGGTLIWLHQLSEREHLAGEEMAAVRSLIHAAQRQQGRLSVLKMALVHEQIAIQRHYPVQEIPLRNRELCPREQEDDDLEEKEAHA